MYRCDSCKSMRSGKHLHCGSCDYDLCDADGCLLLGLMAGAAGALTSPASLVSSSRGGSGGGGDDRMGERLAKRALEEFGARARGESGRGPVPMPHRVVTN